MSPTKIRRRRDQTSVGVMMSLPGRSGFVRQHFKRVGRRFLADRVGHAQMHGHPFVIRLAAGSPPATFCGRRCLEQHSHGLAALGASHGLASVLADNLKGYITGGTGYLDHSYST
jgi:hypothetical protein